MTHLLFTPNASVIVLTLGTILIFVELNRPGTVLPGALGLLGVLLAINSWRHFQLNYPALLLLSAAALFCVWLTRYRLARWWMLPCVAAFSLALATLISAPAPARIRPAIAIVCGCVLGASGSALAWVAQRARQNKGLN